MSATLDSAARPRAASTSQATKRRRAARACLSCRTRKVRCDVSRSGPPCMNCSLDDIECVVKARKPKSSSRHGPGNQQAQPQETVDDDSPEADNDSDPDMAGQLGVNSAPGAHDGVADGVMQDTLLDNSNAMDFAYEDDEESPPLESTTFPQGAETSTTRAAPSQPSGQPLGDLHKAKPFLESELSFDVPSQTASFLPSNQDWFSSCIPDSGLSIPQPETTTARHYSALHPNSVVYNYYPYLTLDNLYNCMPQDVDFMEAEGCFHLPTRSILDQIIRQYFLHVHPLLPLLNEGDFWEMYYNKRAEGEEPLKMSLLLFQAIMFASCNFVNWSMESARSFGYKSVRNLRAAFYRRAKLLYDFGAESSPVAIAQAALLLSYWTPPVRTEMKLNTVWLSVAIQNARNAEAPFHATLPTTTTTASSSSSGPSNTNTNKKTTAEAKRKNLLRRLWWCCVIRDRILPLGLRRGIQITRAHFDFEMHSPLGFADVEDEINRSMVYTSEAKRDLAHVLSHVVRLCVLLTDVLLLVFPLDGALDQARGRLTLMPLEEAEIRKNKRALMLWYRTATSAAAQTSANAGGGADIDWNKHDSVVLFTHVMYTYYHSARMALYHYELEHYVALMATTPSMDARKVRETREEIQNSLANVTENFRGLNRRHLTRWLPISMLAFVAFPLALHVLNTHLSASVARQSPREEALVDVMKSLQLQYDGVDWVAKVIRKLIDLVQDEATASTTTVGRRVTDWSELLIAKPRTYLRMSLAMDMSMSSGRFPDKDRLIASEMLQIRVPSLQRVPRPLAAPRMRIEERTDGPSSSTGLLSHNDNNSTLVQQNTANNNNTTTIPGSGNANPADLSNSAAAVMCDQFSPFQGSTPDMNAFFDASLADFGLGAGFSMPNMDESPVTTQHVDPTLEGVQILAEI